jgi:hypothetical protein
MSEPVQRNVENLGRHTVCSTSFFHPSRTPSERSKFDEEEDEDGSHRERWCPVLKHVCLVSKLQGNAPISKTHTYCVHAPPRHGDPNSSNAGAKRWMNAVAI